MSKEQLGGIAAFVIVGFLLVVSILTGCAPDPEYYETSSSESVSKDLSDVYGVNIVRLTFNIVRITDNVYNTVCYGGVSGDSMFCMKMDEAQ